MSAADERRSRYRIAVVGATGAVGTVMLQCLHERGLDRRATRSSCSPPRAPPGG